MLYADVNHVDEAVAKVFEKTSIYDDEAHISVYDTEAVMRGIHLEEVRERNLVKFLGPEVCSLRYDGSRLTLGFHESQIVEPFTLSPEGPRSIDAKQAPNPYHIAPELDPVCERLDERFDVVSYDFIEVSAASIANAGHFTDFEFKYAVTTMPYLRIS